METEKEIQETVEKYRNFKVVKMAKPKRIPFFKDRKAKEAFEYHEKRLGELFPKMTKVNRIRNALLITMHEGEDLRKIREANLMAAKKRMRKVI